MILADRQCPDDLLARGIRHQVSELERRALHAHLGQCAACRAASALATLFDAVPETLPGDGELLGRVLSRATGKQPFARRWIRAAAMAAGVVVFTGGAAVAWVTVGRRVLEMRSAENAAMLSPARGRVAHRVPAIPSEIPPVAPTVEAPPPAPAAIENAVPEAAKQRPEPPRSVAAVAPSIEPQPTARSLFAEANAVRRAGEIRRAIGLYQRLRRDFPGSAQAILASVSMGDLLLRLGDPAGAVTAYDSYRAHASGGALTEEALFGRARCLARLGRAAEERQTWEELVRRFPRSAYQPAAAKRLKELGN
jgi:TolA-binding protein